MWKYVWEITLDATKRLLDLTDVAQKILAFVGGAALFFGHRWLLKQLEDAEPPQSSWWALAAGAVVLITWSLLRSAYLREQKLRTVIGVINDDKQQALSDIAQLEASKSDRAAHDRLVAELWNLKVRCIHDAKWIETWHAADPPAPLEMRARMALRVADRLVEFKRIVALSPWPQIHAPSDAHYPPTVSAGHGALLRQELVPAIENMLTLLSAR